MADEKTAGGGTLDELRDIIVQPVELTVAGETLAIAPFPFGVLDVVIELALPMIGDLMVAADAVRSNANVDVGGILVKHAKQVRPLMAVLSGRSLDWICRLNLAQAAVLLAKLIEINADFFDRHLLPIVTRLMARLGGRSGLNVQMELTKGLVESLGRKSSGA